MKLHRSHVSCTPVLIGAVILWFVAGQASAQLSEPERLERCENNRRAIVDVQTQLRSNAETYESLQTGRRELSSLVRSFQLDLSGLKAFDHADEFAAFPGPAEQTYITVLKQSMKQIVDVARELNIRCRVEDWGCPTRILAEVDRQVRVRLGADAQLNARLAAHQTNLSALYCDQLAINPGAASPAPAGDSVVGIWRWAFASSGEPQPSGSVTFFASGQMSWSGGTSGRWSQSGRGVTLQWEGNPTTDTMALSADGQTLSGKNNLGWPVRGTR